MTNIQELLKKSQDLKAKIKAQKEELKNAKRVMAQELTAGLSDAEKQKQIAEAQSILETVKQKAETLKAQFKKDMQALKERAHYAKELLEFVNYKIVNGLPKTKYRWNVSALPLLKFSGEDIKEITVDTNKPGWERVFKTELGKQGINGQDRRADNIVYKAQKLLEANTITVNK